MSPTPHKRAFVTFVIRNDSFIPGALVFAYALKCQGVTADILCLASDELTARGVATLSIVFDDVLVIDELFVPHDERHKRQDRPFLFTRFHAFRLGEDGDLGCDYDKIVMADADVLPLADYETLFDLPAPSGILNEDKALCMESKQGKYVIPKSVYDSGTWIWHDHYRDIPHGSPIPKSITDRVLDDHKNMGVNTALNVLAPTMAWYDALIEDVVNEDMLAKIRAFPWPEMQYLTMKLSGQWHNLDLRFASFNGYPDIAVLKGIHYAGLKPWQLTHRSIMHFAKNEDYRLWYATFLAMVSRYPDTLNHPKIRRMHKTIETMVKQPSYRFTRRQLSNVKQLF